MLQETLYFECFFMLCAFCVIFGAIKFSIFAQKSKFKLIFK